MMHDLATDALYQTCVESAMTPTSPTATQSNFLSSDVEITGSLSFTEPMIFEGKMSGDIVTTGSLTVAEKGSVVGNIQAVAISIRGKVTGNVTVTERCELHANAALLGDLKSPRLMIAEGATFVGNSEVIPVDARARASKPAAPR